MILRTNNVKGKLSASTIIFYLFMIWLGNRIGNSFYLASVKTNNIFDFMTYGLDHINLFSDPFPDLNMGAIIGMALLPAIAFIYSEYQKSNRKNFRQKEEHGSARYGRFEEIEHLRDK